MRKCGGKEEDPRTPLRRHIVLKTGGKEDFGGPLGTGAEAELRILGRVEARGSAFGYETGEGAETGG